MAGEPAVEEAVAEDSNAELTDPDDIDALMDSMAGEPAVEEAVEAVAEDSNAELTDPDDIDALMDSLAGEPAPEAAPEPEAIAAEDNVELTDPDDIDALMDSLAGEPAPEAEPEAVASEDNVELTDPDDIDALMDSLAGEPVSEKAPEPEAVAANDNVELTDPDDIDALMDAMSENTSSENAEKPIKTLEPEEIKVAEKQEEYNPVIDDFSEEYVTSFLSADLSDLLVEEEPNNIDPPSDATDTDDELDIDALLAEVNQESDEGNTPLDIGDDILGEENSVESSDVDDDILADISNDFDESTLTQLLNDEKETQSNVELSPDFTDSNVLADLLADGDEKQIEDKVNDAEEIIDIEELDNLDFDELLANIEEEAPQNSVDEFNLAEDIDIEEQSTSELDELITPPADASEENDDFISVDSLISDTLDDTDEGNATEPYEQTNIDVGLGEFPEFTNDVNHIDVDDDDDNGTAAKLDLAKVYIEIGDLENAEVILKDVVSQGDADQQLDAQQLLENMKN